jgi:AcrR family transcriptional regulator
MMGAMPRSGADARRRLQQAALELYLERGYDATTAAQIAERAGVTERSFFRHFTDKREVFFDGEAALRTALVTAVAEARDGLPPLAVLRDAYVAVVPILEENRPLAEAREPVFAATPALRERALAKTEALNGAVAEALRERGLPVSVALLAAQIAMAAFGHAARTWRTDPSQDLRALIAMAFDDIATLNRTSAGSVEGRKGF